MFLNFDVRPLFVYIICYVCTFFPSFQSQNRSAIYSSFLLYLLIIIFNPWLSKSSPKYDNSLTDADLRKYGKAIRRSLAAFESIDALSFTTNLISIEVFNATLDSFSGSVFLFLAGFGFIGFCVTMGNKIYLKRSSTPKDQSINALLDENFDDKAA